MTTGRKIAKLRKQYGFTPEELAEKINVSRQTVHKWEKETVFPNLEHLKQLATIFETTTDYLLYDVKPKPPVKRIKDYEMTSRVKGSTDSEYICITCGKTIRKGEPYFPVGRCEKANNLKSQHNKPMSYGKECINCNKKRIALIEIEKNEKIKLRRMWNFITLAILLVITLAIAIPLYVLGMDSVGVTVFLVIGLLTAFAIPTLILNNTFISDVFLEIVTWGIFKFPGIIFSLDLGGIAFFIFIKIILLILGLVLIIGAILLALLLAGALSIFVYPISLKRNLTGEIKK